MHCGGRLSSVPFGNVQERLGHSNISITMEIYSHVLPGMQEEAASRLDQALRRAMGQDDGGPAGPVPA